MTKVESDLSSTLISAFAIGNSPKITSKDLEKRLEERMQKGRALEKELQKMSNSELIGALESMDVEDFSMLTEEVFRRVDALNCYDTMGAVFYETLLVIFDIISHYKSGDSMEAEEIITALWKQVMWVLDYQERVRLSEEVKQ